MADESRSPAAAVWWLLRSAAKAVGIAVGLPAAVLGVSALVALLFESLWGSVVVAAVVVVGLPLLVVDRLLPELDEHAAPAAIEASRGFTTDVLAIAWLVLALGTLAPRATGTAIAEQAERLDAGGWASVAELARGLGAGADARSDAS